MSGVGEIASVIGLTDVGVKGIHGLHNLIRDLRNVPDELRQLHGETASLQAKLAQLDFLKGEDDNVSAEVAAVGIDAAIEACGMACENFRKQIQGWVRSEPPTLRERSLISFITGLPKRSFKGNWCLEACRVSDGSEHPKGSENGELADKQARQLVHAGKSENDKRVEVGAICERFLEWKKEAKKDRKEVIVAMDAFEDDLGTKDAQAVMEEETILATSFLRSCDDVVEKLKAMKLNQSIDNVVSGGGANVRTGMAATVVDKVAFQRIRNVYSAESSIVRVGIW
ncbi:hypothetical protein LTR27_008245 [Elasticomyces elasticus]|nr:hypothetical protein LTR27_008245 [Elasticomyces elasticus]